MCKGAAKERLCVGITMLVQAFCDVGEAGPGAGATTESLF